METKPLTFGRIFIFWAPLAAQWLMMSVEGPILSAIIARMAEPKFNLAAYGVTLSLALIMESPIIMLISASTALVKDRQSYLKLRRFALILNVSTAVTMSILVIPPIFSLVADGLFGLPEKLAGLVHVGVILMIPWPAMIGYRRFLHGVLIQDNKTRFVAYGTVIRLVVIALSSLLLFFLWSIPGAYVAAASMTLSVIFETLATRLMATATIRKILTRPESEERAVGLTFGAIGRFYVPLALTTIMALGVRPLITIFLGQSRMALESLAVLPVIHALVFIFMSLGLSYQEVGIALMGQRFENYRKLRDFALVLAALTTLALALFSFTPLADLWFHLVSGLSTELTRFSILPLKIMTLLPGLAVITFLLRSVLMSGRNTVPVTWTTAIEVSVIVLSLLIGVHYLDLVGIIAAALALMAGALISNVYIIGSAYKTLNRSPQVAN